SELAVSLPGLSFPLDLSGGVEQFRHRRGELHHLEIRATPDGLAGFFREAASEVMGELSGPVSAWLRPTGIALGVVAARGALAFDLLWAPDREHARVVVGNARGAGLQAPALALALSLLQSALRPPWRREGRVFILERLAARLVTELMPRFGARAPAALGVQPSELISEAGELRLELDSQASAHRLAVDTVRALETAHLARQADELLIAGNLDAA